MSDLKTLFTVAALISLVVGLTSLLVFHIPAIYCVILSVVTGVIFFFIILWSSYLFVFR